MYVGNISYPLQVPNQVQTDTVVSCDMNGGTLTRNNNVATTTSTRQLTTYNKCKEYTTYNQ